MTNSTYAREIEILLNFEIPRAIILFITLKGIYYWQTFCFGQNVRI